MKFSIGDSIQVVIFLISLAVYAQKPLPLYLRLFPVYFFLLLITDLALEYTQARGMHNNIILNTTGIAEFSFYFFVVRNVIENKKVKKYISYTTLIFLVFATVNLCFIQHNDLFNPINFVIGTFITVIFCIYYYFELFRKTEAESLARLTSFWIVSGILFNVVLVFPIFALLSFMDTLSKVNRKTSLIVFDNIDAIFNIISILTYILYSIGFICRIRTSKSIS
jgi:hypothetical protein